MTVEQFVILWYTFLAGFVVGVYYFKRKYNQEDWEGVAADRAFTIAMQKVEIDQLKEKLAVTITALATVPSVPTEEDIEWAKKVFEEQLTHGQQ